MIRVCPQGHRYARGRCPECERLRGLRRGSARQRGYDTAYERRRALLLGLPCELRLPGCTGIADTADHVLPVALGGRDGPLRPACAHCNYARGARQ